MEQDIKAQASSACDENGTGETLEEKRKRYARRCVSTAIGGGFLIRPQSCSQCSKIRFVHAHHNSYAVEFWLVVEWLCVPCHRRRHIQAALEIFPNGEVDC